MLLETTLFCFPCLGTMVSQHGQITLFFVLVLCHCRGEKHGTVVPMSLRITKCRTASEFHGPFVIITNKKANKHEAFGDIIIFRQQHIIHTQSLSLIDTHSLHPSIPLAFVNNRCVVCLPSPKITNTRKKKQTKKICSHKTSKSFQSNKIIIIIIINITWARSTTTTNNNNCSTPSW